VKRCVEQLLRTTAFRTYERMKSLIVIEKQGSEPDLSRAMGTALSLRAQ
jgi:hypothetical protein